MPGLGEMDTWVDQLTAGGRIVVPLRMRGLTRSVAFERADGHLVMPGP